MIGTARAILAWSILLVAFPFLLVGAGIAWIAWQVVGRADGTESKEDD